MGLTMVLVVIILFVGIGFGFFIGRKSIFGSASRKVGVDIRSTVVAVLPIAEFSSLAYHYSEVVPHSDVGRIFNIPIPGTGVKALYIIDGKIKLGFDGREVKIGNQGNDITVYIKIKVLSHEMHYRTYDEHTGLFAKYAPQDRENVLRKYRTEKEDEVNNDDELLTQARLSAEQMFGSLMKNVPELKGATIRFKWESAKGSNLKQTDIDRLPPPPPQEKPRDNAAEELAGTTELQNPELTNNSAAAINNVRAFIQAD